MSNLKLRKDGTPINYRLTGLTVGSVLITRLNRGSLLTNNGELSIVEVIGRGNGSELGSHVDIATEGRGSLTKSYLAINNVALYINNRSVVGVSRGIVISTGYVVVTVVGPDSDRNAEDGVACDLGSIHNLNGNGKNLGNVIISELNVTAVSNDSTLGLPGISVVKLKVSYKLGKVRSIRNVDVNVVYGLCLRNVVGVIMTGKLYACHTVHNKGSGDLCRVAKLVLNLKGNGMSTGEKLYVTLGGKHVAVDRSLDRYTVNKNRAGSEVKSSIIRNGSGKSELVTGDKQTVLKSNCYVGGRISGIGDSGKNSVIHSRAVVKSDIIDIEGKLSRSGGLYVSTDERGRTGVSLICCNRCAEIVVLGDIDRHVYPAGLRNIRLGSRVKVSLLSGSSRGKHKVILLTCVRAISILYVEL